MLRALRISSALVGLFSAALAAQHTTPTTPPRVAGIAPPPAPAPIVPNGARHDRSGFLFGNVPVIVFPDGRVFANFGQGLEQVVRSCGLPVNYGGQVTYGNQVIPGMSPTTQPVVVQPTVTQPTIGATSQPLPYTPPVPAQQTASQQMAAQITGTAQQNQPVINTQSCWAMDAGGRVFVGRQ
jgi:hypothetical protein